MTAWLLLRRFTGVALAGDVMLKPMLEPGRFTDADGRDAYHDVVADVNGALFVREGDDDHDVYDEVAHDAHAQVVDADTKLRMMRWLRTLMLMLACMMSLRSCR